MSRDIIVIGASAGGIEACHHLLRLLPGDLAATIFIVIHISPRSPSVLAKIFARGVQLSVKTPEDGQSIEKSTVYVAPSNFHLVLKPGHVRLSRGPRENSSRPSVDALFRSAAFAYGERVIGVILSGSLNDGTAGLMIIKTMGGVAIVQNPEEAAFPGMPKSAMEFVEVDYVMNVAEIAMQLQKLVGDTERKSIPDQRADEETHSHDYGAAGTSNPLPGAPSHFTCPSCGGSLWESDMERFTEFRCRVGHSFTPASLLKEQSDAIDAAFWRSLRQLEENISLRKKLAAMARQQNKTAEAQLQEEQAHLARRQADSIKKALVTDVARLNDPEPD